MKSFTQNSVCTGGSEGSKEYEERVTHKKLRADDLTEHMRRRVFVCAEVRAVRDMKKGLHR